MIAFVKHHRVCFAALTLRVSHESQLKNRLIFVEHNPFEVPCEKSLTPAHYLDAKATNRYLVQIPVEHFVLSNTTVVKYTIEPKTTVEFIWFLKWVDQGEGKDDVEIVK